MSGRRIYILKSRDTGKSGTIHFNFSLISKEIKAAKPSKGRAYRMQDIPELMRRVDLLEQYSIEQQKLRSGTRLEQSTVCLTVGSGFDSHPDRQNLIMTGRDILSQPIGAGVHGMVSNVYSPLRNAGGVKDRLGEVATNSPLSNKCSIG